MADVVHNPERVPLRDPRRREGGRVHAVPRDADAWEFVHTEIDDAYEGQGLGGQLARGALDDVRANGHKVIATCPFIKGWIAKHEDYQDLLV